MVQERSKSYAKAFVELNEIIQNMADKLQKQIPNTTKKAIQNAMDKDYNFIYDIALPLYEQKLLSETKTLLSVIYSEYLCSDEEKKKWDEYDKFELQKLEEQKVKKYYRENIFENNKINEKEIENKESVELIQYKEKTFFKKIANWFKKFLNIDR